MSNTSFHHSADKDQDPQGILRTWADAVKTFAGALQTQDHRAVFRAFQCTSRLYPDVQAILQRNEGKSAEVRVHVQEALDVWRETAPHAEKWLSDIQQQLSQSRTQRRIMRTYRQKDRSRGQHVKLFAGGQRPHGSAEIK